MQEIRLEVAANADNFHETAYLAANPDVAAAVATGGIASGRQHFIAHGHKEGRRLRLVSNIEPARRAKMARLEPFIDHSRPHLRRGSRYDFLTEELRRETGIVETDAVSANEYDEHVQALIHEFPEGLILDCGAGRRQVYYDNVVNYEIVDYDTTDVLGVGESLPFKDGSFDGVISIAVLEHVRDPFACAAEIVRVLRPGGKLVCAVPFLQPEHGFPKHYYNMTRSGLRALFERSLTIDDQRVIDSLLPVWSLTWMVQRWAEGLHGKTRDEFLALRLGDLLGSPLELLDRAWVRGLSADTNFELASATMLFAHKPDERSAARA